MFVIYSKVVFYVICYIWNVFQLKYFFKFKFKNLWLCWSCTENITAQTE